MTFFNNILTSNLSDKTHLAQRKHNKFANIAGSSIGIQAGEAEVDVQANKSLIVEFKEESTDTAGGEAQEDPEQQPKRSDFDPVLG